MKIFNCFKKKKFLTNNIDNTKKFNLDNLKGKFFVKDVYDGDTITILIPIRQHIYNMIDQNNIDLDSDNNSNKNIFYNEIKIRLLGIDTPEIKPKKDIPNRENHIKKAKAARDFLSDIILNKIIDIQFKNNDKYGRPLAIIYNNNININNLMIEKGFANSYDGKTKDNFI